MSLAASGDTIFAFATPPGRSGVAVLRVSGAAARSVATLCLGALPRPRMATLRTLNGTDRDGPIDQVLAVWMPGPASFTGEDVLELHLHGGVAIRAAALAVVGGVAGLRPADPGEFAYRAFLNGRLDLTEVEGLADLIDAETEAQRRAAIRDASGDVRRLLERWSAVILDAAALLEASLDFSDEELPDGLDERCAASLAPVLEEMRRALLQSSGREVLREGLVVVISGPPNAGKSTLLNSIAGREVAIVTPVAGTTRDLLEVRCDLGGLLVRFVDTAGLRPTNDPVERIGVSRAMEAIRRSDFVLDLRGPDDPPYDTDLAPNVWRVGSKSDLGFRDASEDRAYDVSASTGAGLADLLDGIRREAEQRVGSSDAWSMREHHRYAVKAACDAVGRATVILAGGQEVLAAEELRVALNAIGRITGHVGVDAVLDRVFGRFCIGK